MIFCKTVPGLGLSLYSEILKMNIFPDKTDFHDPYWFNPGDKNSCR